MEVQSPISSPLGAELVNEYRVDSNVFKEMLAAIIKQKNQMYKLKAALALLGKNDRGISVNLNGRMGVFTKTDFKSLDSELNKKIKLLGKYFTESKKKVSRGRRVVTGKPQGFGIAVEVNQNLQNFFRNANLGGEDARYQPSDSNLPLNSILLLTTNGITTRSILTTLFNIYNYLNGMQQTRDEEGALRRGILTATPLMNQWLGSSYDLVRQRQLQKARDLYNKRVEQGLDVTGYPIDSNGQPALIDKKGNIIPWFNQNAFGFKNFSQIASVNITPNKPAVDQNITAALRNEQLRASANLYYYGWYRDIMEAPKLPTTELKQAKVNELNNKYALVIQGTPIKVRNASGKSVENPELKIKLKPE